MSDQTYAEFVEANANGWVVVYIGRERTPKAPLFVNVVGPFDDKAAADRRAANMRRKYKRQGDWAYSTMEKVSVRPLWNTDIKE